MIIKKDHEIRRCLLVVAILFGVNVSPAYATTDLETESLTNENIAAGDDSKISGLHVSGTNDVVTQNEDISLSIPGAVGIHVEGSKNQLTIPKGTTINVNGQGGTGILISKGIGHTLDIFGDVFAKGNAVEFNFVGDEVKDALVKEFNVWGSVEGGNHAIYIGEKSFVENININGANLSGDIVSAWIPNAATKVTNLNFNGDSYHVGNISGTDGIKMHIQSGTLKFSGSANVLSVDVNLGAKLFGGTFSLNGMNTMDNAAGTFTNHGTIAAGSPDTNLIINGNLISDGILQKVSGGKAGSIIVTGTANIEGSTVTTDSLLPNETATVLIAKSIKGNIKNPTDKPISISAMLTATGKIVGNTLLVTTHESNQILDLDFKDQKTLDAMNYMFENLPDAKQDEMRDFYNLKPDEARETLTQIGSNDSAQIMSVAQQNTNVDRMVSNRIAKVFAPEFININMRPLKFADGDDSNAPDMTVKVKVPSRQENNFWLNYMKSWGSLRGGTDYHGSAIVGGYDRPIGKKWRAGIFATYGTIGYGAESSRATVYDTRLGLYAGYHNRASDVYIYANGGQLRNSLHRGIYSLDLLTNANYKSRIFEVGGEYKYDLSPKKVWHVSPFINFQVSYLKQNAYNERGAGIYNQHVDANSNTYFAAQTGLDLKRYYRTGMFGMRFGVKHGFTGADPDLTISYEGDTSTSYRLRQKRDKTHFIFSVRGENEFARGWFIGGEAELQRGEKDRDVTASVMLRRTW